jgi:hypothetical protein
MAILFWFGGVGDGGWGLLAAEGVDDEKGKAAGAS